MLQCILLWWYKVSVGNSNWPFIIKMWNLCKTKKCICVLKISVFIYQNIIFANRFWKCHTSQTYSVILTLRNINKLQAFQTDSARSIYFSTKADWLYRWSRPFLGNTHSPTQQPAQNLLKITFKIHQLKVASFFPYGKDSLHLFIELTWPNKSEKQAKIFATLSFCLMWFTLTSIHQDTTSPHKILGRQRMAQWLFLWIAP